MSAGLNRGRTPVCLSATLQYSFLADGTTIYPNTLFRMQFLLRPAADPMDAATGASRLTTVCAITRRIRTIYCSAGYAVRRSSDGIPNTRGALMMRVAEAMIFVLNAQRCVAPHLRLSIGFGTAMSGMLTVQGFFARLLMLLKCNRLTEQPIRTSKLLM